MLQNMTRGMLMHIVVPRRYLKGTIVMSSSIRPAILPSVHQSVRPETQSCLPNFSYSFQGISMKLSSNCSHDLKMIIFYRGHARLIFTRVMALDNFNSKSCLCNSCCSFQWILLKPSSYCSHGLKRIILYQGHV